MSKNPLLDVLTRTSTDKAYREEFLRDPAGVLRRAGIQVPEGRAIKVLENSDDQMYIVIPTSAEDQPANWERQERPAPGERKEAPGLIMEWTEDGLVLIGRIDNQSAQALRDELDRVSGNLFVDFRKVTFMSSVGLSVLLATRKRLQPNGKTISLCNVPEPIMNIFALTTTDTLFQFYDPEDVTPFFPGVVGI